MSSLSLVRYKTNGYSVPVAYGHRDVIVRGYVDQVVISCGSEVIAKHPRSYERDDFVYDPSTTSRCWSVSLAPWTRPLRCRDGSCRKSLARCGVSWSRVWAEGQTGVCTGVQAAGNLLPAGGTYSHQGRSPAGCANLRRPQALGAVPVEGRPPRLDLELYPYLPRVRVSATSAKDYMSLLPGRAA